MNNIKDIIDKNEKIIWRGKPVAGSFVLSSSMPIFLLGIVWLIIVSVFTSISTSNVESFMGDGTSSIDSGFKAMSLLVGFMPLTVSFIMLIARAVEVSNIEYVLTDKRVFIKRGIIGTDYKTIDYSSMNDIKVKVGLIDKIFDTGSVIFDEKLATRNNTIVDANESFGRFACISKPYKVFKLLKDVAFDVKTDINYPNNYRPKDNDGYNTKYNGKKKSK